MTSLTLDRPPAIRRKLFDVLADGVTAGLPIPTSVGFSTFTDAGRLTLWMARPEDVRAWQERLALTWSRIWMYPGSRGGWQWSVHARGTAAGMPINVEFIEALEAPGPVPLPAWLVTAAGVADPEPEGE